jgi:ribosomal protein S18 acetylase RimI-like enzyme
MWLLACAMDDGTIMMLTLASAAEDDAPAQDDAPAAFERTDTLSWQRTLTLVLQPAAAEAAMTPGCTSAVVQGCTAAVVQLAWSADGKWLIAGTADGALHAVGVAALLASELQLVAPGKTIIVRPMADADLSQCADIEAQSYPNCEGLDMFIRELNHYRRGCWVAQDVASGSVAGYAICMPVRFRDCPRELSAKGPLATPAADADDRTLYLHDLAVGPKCRGLGVAARLLQCVVEGAILEMCDRITLTSVCGSRAFWQHHGFEALAPIALPEMAALRLRTYPQGLGDVCMMQRRIDASSMI